MACSAAAVMWGVFWAALVVLLVVAVCCGSLLGVAIVLVLGALVGVVALWNKSKRSPPEKPFGAAPLDLFAEPAQQQEADYESAWNPREHGEFVLPGASLFPESADPLTYAPTRPLAELAAAAAAPVPAPPPCIMDLPSQPYGSLPPPCGVTLDWEPRFIGATTSFVPAKPEPEKLYCKDPRAWETDLNKLILERTLTSNDEIDFYKHYHARQAFAQFVSKDLVYRKDRYAEPLGQIEDSPGVAAPSKQ